MMGNLTRIGLSIIVALTLPIVVLPQMLGPEPAQGSEWKIYALDYDGSVGRYTSIALDRDGNPCISYGNSKLKYGNWTGSRWNVEIVDTNVGVSGTSIALDSNGDPHIAYFDSLKFDLKYVRWDGTKWKIETIDSAGEVGNNPSIALDAHDRPHISYYDQTNHNLKYARWTGVMWDIETVDSAYWVGLYTSIALDSNGYPHISYFDYHFNYDLKYANWTGSGWNIETVDSAGDVGYYTSIALDSHDYPHISYYDLTNGDLKYAKWTGRRWNTERVDWLDDVGQYTSIALDSHDYPHVSYYDNTNKDLKYANWTGSGWNIETVDSPGWVGWYNSLALDHDDYPHISYYDLTNGDLKYATKAELGPENKGPVADAGPDQVVYEGDVVQFNGTGSRDSDSEGETFTFAPNIKVNDDNGSTHQGTPSIAIDSKGIIHVVWADNRNGNPDIYYAKSTDGGLSFGTNMKVNDDTGIAYQEKPSIAVDDNGSVFVVWQDWRNDADGHSANDGGIDGVQNEDVYFAKSIDGGESFGPNVKVNDEPAGLHVQHEPDIAVDDMDVIHIVWVAWEGYTNLWDVFYTNSMDGGISFGEDVRVNDITRGSQADPSIAVDSKEYIHVAWHCIDGGLPADSTNIRYSRSTDGGLSFEASVRVNDDTGTASQLQPSIAVDSHDNIHIVWQDARSGPWLNWVDIYYAKSTNEGISFHPNVKVNNDTGIPRQSWPSIAVDSNNSIYVVWTDWRNDADGGPWPPGGGVDGVNNTDIYFASSTDGKSFEHNIRVNDDTGTAAQWSRERSLAVDNDGHPHIVWSDRRNGDYDVYYAKGVFARLPSNLSYFWDFDASVDSDGDGNSTNDIDATGPTPTWVYGDDGNFRVTLKVTDESGNWDTDTMNVTVLNIPPEVTVNYSCAGAGPTDILLRITGERWHDVTFTIFEDDREIYNESVMRVPGNPNEQIIGLEDFEFNMSRSYSAIVKYTPEDDKVNGQKWGATPAWIILRSGGKEMARLHHTFNVRHTDTWEWRVDDLGSYLPQLECIFTADIYDPGSDDIHVVWDWGDGMSSSSLYYNDGVGPDPYPSPDVNPILVTDTAVHRYPSAGTYTVTLSVRDDDGGSKVISLTLVV